MTVRQTDNLLRHRIISHPRRIDIHIREHIVHRRQPRRIEIADPRHLHRCGTVRENGQRIPLRMPREIDENIHLIMADERRRLRRRTATDIMPHIHRGAHLRRERILCAARIAIDGKLRAVILREERAHEPPDGMHTEIGRDIADADARMPTHGVRRPRLRQDIGKERIVAVREPRIERAQIRRQIVHGKERVAVLHCPLGTPRLQLCRREKRRDSLLCLPRLRQRRAEETVRTREKHRIVRTALLLLCHPPFQHLDQRAQMRDLRRELPLRAVDIDLLPRRARMIGTHGADACDLRPRCLVCPRLRQRSSENIAHLHILGQNRQQLLRDLRRTRILPLLVEIIGTQENLLPQRLHIVHTIPPFTI